LGTGGILRSDRKNRKRREGSGSRRPLKLPTLKEKEKKLLPELLFKSHITENGISRNGSKAYGDGMRKKKTQATRF
jgi:hypothetical protein